MKNDSNYDGNCTARHCLSGTYEISWRWIFVRLSVHVCRLLPCTRLSTPGRIRSHSEGRLQVPHSRRRTSGCHGGLSACYTRLHVRGRGPGRLQVRERQLSPTHPRRHGSARLFLGTEYISLTQPDMDYLVRVFPIMQQELRYYLIAMPDVLSYVTSSLASPKCRNSDYCKHFH